MSNSNTEQSVPFHWTWTQRLWVMVIPLVVSAAIVLYGPYLTGWTGTVILLGFGAVLGVITWFISAGWAYKVEVTGGDVRIREARGETRIPFDRLGMVIRNGGVPFPTLWLVLRNAEVGREVPVKGVDAQAAALIESYRKRNPGKKVTVVQVAGGHLRSVSGFAEELRRRVPPLVIDERLTRK